MASLYRPIDNKNGIFQHMYIENKKFASFKNSSIETGNIQNIFKENDDHFITNNEPNSSITIKLSHNLVKLTYLSMYSCISSNCFMSIDVLGSNRGNQWNEVCKIRTNESYFMKKIALVECKSNFFYRSIKLVQSGLTISRNNYFLLRYLEMFGYLSPLQLTQCLCRRRQSISIYCIIIILQ